MNPGIPGLVFKMHLIYHMKFMLAFHFPFQHFCGNDERSDESGCNLQ
jgi:hypothetical protein